MVKTPMPTHPSSPLSSHSSSSAISPLPIAVLISGNGSNLQAIIDAIANGTLHATIKIVISNRADAYGLQRASAAGIATEILTIKSYPSREEYDNALRQCLDHYHVDLIVLAGFMRILSSEFVRHYKGRLINIHPSLLPLHPGLNTHEKVIIQGDKQHGASVHFVSEEVDCGPIIIQGSCNVLPNDTIESITQKVHAIEHQIYPQAIEWYAEGRLELTENGILLNGKLLAKNGMQRSF